MPQFAGRANGVQHISPARGLVGGRAGNALGEAAENARAL